MKTLELEFDLIELKAEEKKDVSGGWPIWIAGGLLGGLVVSALDHWSDIKNGALDGLNDI